MLTTVEFIVIALVAIVLGAAGWLLGYQFGREILVAVAGVALAFPIGLLLTRGQRRWIAIALLVVWFVLSYVAGGWQGAFYAIAASGLTFFVSAAILAGLYGGGIFTALYHHLRLALGLLSGFQIIGDGKTLFPKDANEVMGPRLVIVRPNNAVILERGPQQSRISGPGILTSQQYEYVRAIYDLRPQQSRITFTDVMTGNIVPTTAEVCVVYGINISEAARLGQTNWTPDDRRIIRQVDSWASDWEQGIRAAIEGSVRETLGSLDVADLVTGGTRQDIGREIHRLTAQKVRTWGIQLHKVVIESVRPTKEVAAATEKRWIAEVESDTTRINDMARAVGMREMLIILNQAYRQVTGRDISDDQIHREMLRHTLEKIAKDPAAKFFFTPALEDLLSGRHS